VPAIKDELKEAVAASATAMCDNGLTWGTDAGDSSLRDEQTGLIYILPKPSPARPIHSWRDVGARDVAVVDVDGNKVGDDPNEPTVELLTHLRIYQHRPEVNGIVHSHGNWSRVFAAVRQPVPPLMIDSYLYTGATQIECSIFGEIGSDVVAMSAVGCLGTYGKAALLANHGAVCVGSSIDDAMNTAVITEDMSRIAILAGSVGNAQALVLSDFADGNDTDDARRAQLLARYEL
jgi:ribulose-5-phosphate 4-epimerase/fuculose-1-phosphate aldolase